MFVYLSGDLNLLEYTDSNFQVDKDPQKSTSRSLFTLCDRAVV